MTSQAPADAEEVRRSIRERVRAAGDSLGSASAVGMVAVLGGAALWPVVAPLLGTGVALSMVGGGMGLLSGPGQEFISRFLKRHAAGKDVEPAKAQTALERALLDRLQGQDQQAAALRQEISGLLRSVDGVQTAMASASAEVQDALARGLADVSDSWREFGWMLSQVEQRLVDIADRQAYGLALQRESLDLQREQLVKTNLLLQRRRAHPAAAIPEPPPGDAPCPYKGLESFQPEDADYYFGREALVAEGLARLSERGLVAVVGASGSGKSSFLRAGLVAALWEKAENGRVIVLTPGARPLEEVALRIALQRGVAAGSLLADLRADPSRLELAARQALLDAPDGARLTLVVDQLEEIFTLCRDEAERRAFLEALLHAQRAPHSPVRLIFAVRADFYGRLAAFSDLAGAVQDDQVLVGRMTAGELRRTIEEPAAVAGLALEPGLAQTILEDLGDEPGALPLLSHALLETWRRRRGTTLTVAGYREAGGVRGAIAQSAERVVAELDPSQRAIAREVFLSVTEVGEGSEPTRRPAPRDELAGSEPVVERLAEARLLTVDEGTVQVAHEALIRHWPTLRAWLEDEREGLLLQRRLTQAAREWHALGRESGALYRGARLAAARDWASEHRTGPLERDFLEASAAAERSELETARRRTRRLRVLAAALAAMLVLAGISALLAVRSADRARDQQRASLSRSLATQALSDVRNIDRAALLSLEALRAKPTFEARDTVLSLLPLLERSAGALRGHTGTVSGVAFSPDGRTLASAAADGTLRLWDVKARGPVGRPLTGHTEPVQAVAFSPDGDTLASAGDDRTVRLWDVKARRPLGQPLTGHAEPVQAVAFSPDGDMLAAAGDDDTIRFWDVATRRQRGQPLTGHTNDVNDVAFSPDGRTLASAADDETVRIWDVATRRQRGQPLKGHDGWVLSVAFSPDGGTLATGSTDNDVRLWDTKTRRPLGEPLKGHRESVGAVAFSPDGRRLASASVDQTLRLWDVRARETIGQPLVGHSRAAVAVAFSADGRTLASGSVDHAIRLWDTRRSLNRPLTRHAGWVTSVAFSPDRRTLASGGFDHKVRLWDLRANRPLGRPLTGHTDVVGGLAFGADGRTLASASTDGAVGLWDMRTRRPVAGVAHTAAVRGVALSPDGRTLASASADGNVRLWNVRTRRPLGRPLTGHANAVVSVAFSPDGKTLASAGEDGTVRLWEVATRRPLGTPLEGHTDRVRAVAFSPDGKLLASAGYDRSVRLWDASTRRPLGQPLAGHTGPIASLAFSPDGRTLASAGDSVRLWDVGTRRPLGQGVSPGSGLIQSVAFGPDGRALASGGLDEVVRVWDSILWSDDPRALRRHICDVVNYSLSRAEWADLVPGEPYHRTCP